MSESNGKNPLGGLIGFVVIVALLTGFNHWRQSSSIKSQCNEGGVDDAFCSCLSSEMMSSLGIQSSLPLVGRFFKNDEQWDAAQTKASIACVSELPA